MATQQPGLLSDAAFAQQLAGMGYTTEQMRQMLMEKRAKEQAAMSPEQQQRFLVAKGVGQLGRGVAGLFGAQLPEDPALQGATAIRNLSQQFDLTTSSGLREAARSIAQAQPDTAMKLMQQALELEGKEAKVQSERALTEQRLRERKASSIEEKAFLELAKKATPASVKKAQEAGNDISLLEIPEKEKLSTYGQVLVDAGFTPGSPEFQKRMQEFAAAELKGTSTRGQTTVQVGLNMEKPADVSAFRGKLLDTIKEPKKAYDAAVTAETAADNALKTKNFASANLLASSLAKAAGDTQISNKDVEKYRVDPSLIGSVADTVTRLARGTPTEDTLKKLRQLARLLKEKNKETIDTELATQRDIAKSSGFKQEDIDVAFRGVTPSAKAKRTITLRSGAVVEVED